MLVMCRTKPERGNWRALGRIELCTGESTAFSLAMRDWDGIHGALTKRESPVPELGPAKMLVGSVCWPCNVEVGKSRLVRQGHLWPNESLLGRAAGTRVCRWSGPMSLWVEVLIFPENFFDISPDECGPAEIPANVIVKREALLVTGQPPPHQLSFAVERHWWNSWRTRQEP